MTSTKYRFAKYDHNVILTSRGFDYTFSNLEQAQEFYIEHVEGRAVIVTFSDGSTEEWSH